jgi:serine/threonine protein kinase
MVPHVPDQGETKIAGRYRLLRTLGQGGMGTVWLAQDELLHREVAVKELRLPPSLDPAGRAEACRRSVREAMAAAQLRDPGIIKVHDVLTEHDRPWIVMELLRGRNLEDAVRSGGPWPPEQVAHLGLRLLAALSVAHAQGVQHRDVKPANVFLTDDGRTVLTDFGIARMDDQATMTQAGLLIGSPGFIAPERLRGERGGPESDLWSLAATLYATAEGAPPYAGGSPMMVLREVLTNPPRPLRRAGHLGPVLLRMLAGEPAGRLSAGELHRHLESVAAGRRALTAPPGPRRKNLTLAMVVAGVCAVVAAVTVLVVAMKPPQPSPTPVTQRSSAPAETATTAISTSPKPRPKETARFLLPIDFCTLLTAEQVAELVPEAASKGGKRDGEGCEWTSRGVGVSAEPLQVDEEFWAGVPEAAEEAFINKKNSRAAESGTISWRWPAIGLKDYVRSIGGVSRPLEGVGEEATTYDLLSRKTRQVERSFVVFRLSNLLVQVSYIDANKIGKNAAIQDGAVKTARWVADAIEETS